MAETFPQLLLQRAAESGEHPALREKIYGIWQSMSWKQYAQHMRDFAQGLAALGLQPHDSVAIIGDNRVEWLYAELAAQAAGARSVGIYQDAVASEMDYVITHAQVRFVMAEDQEQVDKLIEMWDRLSGVVKVIYFNPRGLRQYIEPYLMYFPDVEKLGREFEAQHPGWFEERVAAGKADDIAILGVTSGVTGNPKLAMLSHANLMAMAQNMWSLNPLKPTDRFVSYLPMSWIGEQMMSYAAALLYGFTVHFPESPDTALANIREIGPQILISPPAIWETLASRVQVRMQDSTRLKRAIYDWALNIGYRMAEIRFRKQKPSICLRLFYWLADLLVLMHVKDHLGLRHVRHAYTGGASLGPDAFRFFHALGVSLKQIYGQTEAAGISVMHRDRDIKFQTVGIPIPGTQVRIDESGEIQLKSAAVFKGYFRNAEATEAALSDGWLNSGDAGYFDEDGHLIVIDRANAVMALHDGTKFSPQFIENKLKFSPYIQEAVVFGGGWPYITTMISIDFSNVGKWAENAKIPYTTYSDLAQKPQVYELIRQQIRITNADLPKSAQIRRFVLLHKELDADEAELTRTRKVRRGFVAQRYDDIILALYSHNDSVEIETTVVYQDGKTALIQTHLVIETIGDGDRSATGANGWISSSNSR